MKRVLLSICCLFFIFTISEAKAKDTFIFDSEGRLSGYTVELHGPFSQPVEFNPNESIIGYTAKNKSVLLIHGAEYKYVGRTGEKTFDIEIWHSAFKGKNIVHYYFEEGAIIDLNKLQFNFLPNYEDNIFKLRLISLTGNKLKCEVIVPEEWRSRFK